LFLSSTWLTNDEQKVDFGSIGFPIADSPSGFSRVRVSCLTGAIQNVSPMITSHDLFRPSVTRVSPTMPSADFCTTITIDLSIVSCSFNTVQTSRGKTLNFHRVDAQFIKHIPIADGGLSSHEPKALRGACSARWPQISHNSYWVLVHRPAISPREPTVGTLGFLQTLLHDNALALSLTFGSANTWYEDLHLASARPCPAHTS